MTRDRDDDIGYGKPLSYAQFRKGKSGNPNGRPRKQKAPEALGSTDFEDVLRELNNRKLTIKIGGRPQKVSAF